MLRLVVVDDEYYAIEGMKQMLDWSKYDISIVGTATDGTQGLEIIRELGADIVIADIKMPELDGLGMIKILRDEGYKGRIIVISGYQSFEYAQTAIDYKVDKYLTKPLDAVEFENVIKNLVEELKEDLGELMPVIPDLLRNVLEEVNMRYAENIQLSGLAEKFFCSTANLSKLFKRYIGMNYIEYVRKLRIKKAKELLKRTNKTIEEISNEVGWESSKRFRDVFKEFEGISPNEYRKNGEKD